MEQQKQMSFEELSDLLFDIDHVSKLDKRGIFYIRHDEKTELGETTSTLYIPYCDGVASFSFIPTCEEGEHYDENRIYEAIDVSETEKEEFDTIRKMKEHHKQMVKDLDTLLSLEASK